MSYKFRYTLCPPRKRWKHWIPSSLDYWKITIVLQKRKPCFLTSSRLVISLEEDNEKNIKKYISII